MGLSAAALVACLLAVLLGGCVQSVVGFGLNLVAVPIIAIAAPEAVPGGIVLLSLPMTIAMATRERHAIDRTGVGWVIGARVPGTFVGLVIVGAVSADLVSTVVGVLILLGVGLSVARPPADVTPGRAATAGVVSGVMGTTAGVDGPPLALLYQHHAGERLRATLAVVFIVGTLMSGTALALTGHIGRDQLAFTLAMLPAMGIGMLVGQPLRSRLHSAHLRPAVLAFAGLAGVAAIVHGLV